MLAPDARFAVQVRTHNKYLRTARPHEKKSGKLTPLSTPFDPIYGCVIIIITIIITVTMNIFDHLYLLLTYCSFYHFHFNH